MSTKNEQGGMDVTQKNVLQKPLHKHSPQSGYCNASNPIAALLTASFLDFAAKSGTDLRKQKSANPGDRYCVSAAQWKEATSGGGDDVPAVKLECTHVSALDTVDLATLKKYAAGQDVSRGVEWTKDKKSGAVRESQEIGGKEPKA